jgi:prepilin-type N-terminal cleavage/methylation domain-containing protein
MNSRNKGFSLAELLIASTILLILIGGICQILLAVPQTAYMSLSTMLGYQRHADVWFLLTRDAKRAGFGFTRIPALVTFPAFTVNYNETMSSCSFFWNKDGIAAQLAKKTVLQSSRLYLRAVDAIRAGDFAVLAENDPITAQPRWALIKVAAVERFPDETLEIMFTVLSTGPLGNVLEFHEKAWYLKAEKINYVFFPDKGKIERIINDAVYQPVAEFVEENQYRYCKDGSNSVLPQCLEYSVAYWTSLKTFTTPNQKIYIPNIL